MDWEEKYIVQQLRARQRISEFILRQTLDKTTNNLLARQAEKWVARRMEAFGYHTAPTPAKHPFDLWAWNDRGGAIRVEVKISLYCPYHGYGRYQAAIRNHDHDLLIFVARNGRDWPFVIPAEIVPRTNLTIWTPCPGDSKPWRPYLEAWDYLHQAIASHQPIGWQLPLF